MATVALVSGGIDSAVMCKIIESQGEEVVPLFINYGQLAANREWECCQNLFRISKLPSPSKLEIPGFGKHFPSGLTSAEKKIKEEAFLPCRNLLFLVMAAAEAYKTNSDKIAIGLLTEETHLFPDQTQKFIVDANFAVNAALDKNLIILTPLIQFKKSEVLELAKKHGIDVSKTYSCHMGGEKYCGKCISCQELLDANPDLPQFKEKE